MVKSLVSCLSRQTWQVGTIMVFVCAALLRPAQAQYNSGSTGADGAFNPAANVEVQLPPNGTFNFTTVNIPAGVTVKFKRNAANTPVFMLATGDVTIAGTIDVSGETVVAGETPGKGGPGGFDGGRGTIPLDTTKVGRGQGPGGGFNTGGSYATVGWSAPATATYGTPELQPLIGGSGGSGREIGGGGGGGAILIACNGTLTVNGSILARGGNAGTENRGIAGSGGAIRLAATTVTIPAAPANRIDVRAGWGNNNTTTSTFHGGNGRIRVEGITLNVASAAFAQAPSVSNSPSPSFLPTNPTLRITSVAGQNVPQNPTGSYETADIVLPATQANPVTIGLAASGIPTGAIPRVRAIPRNGSASQVDATPLAGSEASSTASAQVNLNDGTSLIEAEVTFTQTLLAWLPLDSIDGEKVRKGTLVASLGGRSQLTYTTASGRQVRDDQIHSIVNRKGSTQKR